MKRRAKEKILVPIATKTEVLIPAAERHSLAGWFALYLGVEVEPESEMLDAKTRDLQAFLNFFSRVSGSDKPELRTPVVTKAFQKQLGKAGKKPSTINRGLATLRHAASWIHQHRPFPAGHPCANVTDIQTEEPSWKGLSDIDVTRLRAASETLLVTKKRHNQLPLRDHAIFLVLLHTGLRVIATNQASGCRSQAKFPLREPATTSNLHPSAQTSKIPFGRMPTLLAGLPGNTIDGPRQRERRSELPAKFLAPLRPASMPVRLKHPCFRDLFQVSGARV